MLNALRPLKSSFFTTGNLLIHKFRIMEKYLLVPSAPNAPAGQTFTNKPLNKIQVGVRCITKNIKKHRSENRVKNSKYIIQLI